MTITFDGRRPSPSYATIGMEGEHNAETLILEGLPEHAGTVALVVCLPDGSVDALPVTNGAVTITRDTTLGGTITAWVCIMDGAQYTWKSEKFYLRVGDLPDTDTPMEKQYPGLIEDMAAMAEEATAAAEQATAAAGSITGMTAQATTLDPWESATAAFDNGVLSLGIPRGTQGVQGPKGDTGAQGPKGDKGDKGDPGSGGVPSGGSTYQVLSKTSNADGAAGWRDVRELPGGGGNAQQFLISDWGQNSWEYLSYIMSMSTEEGTGDKIVGINEIELWNVYYSGRPIRLWDDTEGTDNLWTLTGLCEDSDGDGLPVFLMEYKRLKNDFTWETMKMRAASEDGSYIARIVT